MENLLLIFDELDDFYAMVGLVWRPILSFLCAAALFVLTGFIFYRMPMTVGLVGASLLTLGLIDAARERRPARSVSIDDVR